MNPAGSDRNSAQKTLLDAKNYYSKNQQKN